MVLLIPYSEGTIMSENSALKQQIPAKQVDREEIRYRLPLCKLTVSRSKLFGTTERLFMRVEDVEKIYGIPRNTIRDLIANADKTGFPYFHIGRSLYIPRVLLEEWIIAHSTMVPINSNETTPSQCPSPAVLFTPSTKRKN